MSKLIKKKAPLKKKGSKVVRAKKSSMVMPSAPALASGALSNAVSVLPVAYNIDLNHYFIPEVFKDGKTAGARVKGCFPIADVHASSLSIPGSGCLSSLGGSSTTEVLHVNPLILFPTGSPEFNYFTNFARFRFTAMRLIYQTFTNTGTSSVVSLGYYPDGSLIDSDVSVTTANYSPGNMNVVSWSPKKSSDVSSLMERKDWFYVDYDNSATAADADYRQSFQGAIYGVWNTVPGTLPQTIGRFWVEYMVEVVEPRYSYDVALLKERHSQDFCAKEKRLSAYKRLRRDQQKLAREDIEKALQPPEPVSDEPSLPEHYRVRFPASERSPSAERKSRK